MRIKSRILPSSSLDKDGRLVIDLHAPQSWGELTQDQLRYVLKLMVRFNNPIRLAWFLGHRSTPHQASFIIKTHLLCRFSGVKIHRETTRGYLCSIRTGWLRRKSFFLQTWQVMDMLSQFGWIDELGKMDNRLDVIHGLHAVDTRLHGVIFADYLNMEKYFFAYQQTKSQKMLEKLALLLYLDADERHSGKKIHLNDIESLNVFIWYAAIKEHFSHEFKHFFRKVDGDGSDSFNMMESINTQIRALTDGDVTKEEEILNIDCWRALTELNQKAREAEEYKKKYGSK